MGKILIIIRWKKVSFLGHIIYSGAFYIARSVEEKAYE